MGELWKHTLGRDMFYGKVGIRWDSAGDKS